VTESIIGYDLRSTVQDPPWTIKRRTIYLLRRDVATVRSVDTHVWEQPPGFLAPPDWELLWEDLGSLRAAAQAVEPAGTVAVRITAFGPDGWTPVSDDPNGPASERSVLLGYDVADQNLLSGLTNCGYKPEEAASLAPAWAPLLNQWHLFDDPANATAFAAVTGERVPEHAPFFCFGLYQLG
jgi:hypothetical protein